MVLDPDDGDGVVCVYDPDSPLNVWVTHANADGVQACVDDRQTDVIEGYTVDYEPGRGMRLQLPEQAERLQLSIPQAEPWSLRLRDESELEPELPEQRRAFQARMKELQTRLIKRDMDALEDAEQLARDGLSIGLLSDVIRLAAVVSYFATISNQPRAAQQFLEDLRPATQSYPLGRAILQIYLARPLERRGHRFAAAMASREGVRAVRRAGEAPLEVDGLVVYSALLADFGYFEAAARWATRALAQGRIHLPNQVPLLLESVAETNLRLKAIGRPHEDPLEFYGELLELSGTDESAASSRSTAVARLGLAQNSMLDHDYQGVLDQLRRLDRAYLPPASHAVAYDLELKARSLSGAGPSTLDPLLAEFEALTEEQPFELGMRWRLQVRRGHVLEARGDDEGAQRAYERAEEFVDELLLLAALGIGGEDVAARHHESTRRLVSLLLRGPSPRVDEALCVVRRHRARLSRLPILMKRLDDSTQAATREEIEQYLRAKDAYEQQLRDGHRLPRDEYEQAERRAELQRETLQRRALSILSTRSGYELRPRCEALPTRRADELLLALLPLDDEILVLAKSDEQATHLRISREGEDGWSAPSAVPDAMLESLGPLLDQTSRIRVVASGVATRVPVHAMSWQGQPLGLTRSVVYGLEFPSTPADASNIERRAVVLHDDRALGAFEAATEAAAALRSFGLEVHEFSTGDPHPDEVREQLLHASHFFYGGHAYFDATDSEQAMAAYWPPYPGGATEEPAHLPLGAFSRLEVPDIHMFPSVPRVAVLMGCATGMTPIDSERGGQSLAAAFVGAGTSAAIASTRTVDATQAFILSDGLYHHLGDDALEDPGAWMRDAMKRARTRGFDAESIADYRVFVP